MGLLDTGRGRLGVIMAVPEVVVHRRGIHLRRSGYEGSMARMVCHHNYCAFLGSCFPEWHVDVQDTRKSLMPFRAANVNGHLASCFFLGRFILQALLEFGTYALGYQSQPLSIPANIEYALWQTDHSHST